MLVALPVWSALTQCWCPWPSHRFVWAAAIFQKTGVLSAVAVVARRSQFPVWTVVEPTDDARLLGLPIEAHSTVAYRLVGPYGPGCQRSVEPPQGTGASTATLPPAGPSATSGMTSPLRNMMSKDDRTSVGLRPYVRRFRLQPTGGIPIPLLTASAMSQYIYNGHQQQAG